MSRLHPTEVDGPYRRVLYVGLVWSVTGTPQSPGSPGTIRSQTGPEVNALRVGKGQILPLSGPPKGQRHVVELGTILSS